MENFKRYLLFYGDIYYPQGGMDDYKNSFDSLEEAVIFVDTYINENKIYDTVQEEWEYRWAHVYDITTMNKVWAR